MIVTSIDRLVDFWKKHPDAEQSLTAWLYAARNAHWRNLVDLRRSFAAHADAVVLKNGLTVTIFNIRGNRYRLITAIDYDLGAVAVRTIMTHAEYSKEKWKSTL